MNNRNDTHKNITKDVKEIIGEKAIVLPAYYAKVYGYTSKENGLELFPQELIDSAILDEKIASYINSLSEQTGFAIDAIHQNDKEKLQIILKEMEELKQEIHKLKILAYKDSLTGCFNRRWFDEKYLDDENSTFTANAYMVFVDLNRLKRINDKYGHIVGDKVIKYLGLKLKEASDSVVRYGGDEFVLIFKPEQNDKEVEKVMKETYDFFSKVAFKREETSFKVTFAYGISCCNKGDLLNDILNKADKEMYKFKEGRRNKSK